MKKSLFSLFVFLLCFPTILLAEIEESLVLEMKKRVVNIKVSVSYALDNDRIGVRYGTGFVVDSDLGLLVTNKHVSGVSPCLGKMTLENGETTEISLLYFDPFHDFAFFKYDPKKIGFKTTPVEFSNSYALKEQDEVFLIGNNEGEEYSVKFGRVTNLIVDKGDRHSATFQTSFDRTGGSSGSPVFNHQGKVVGIHFKGTNTTSFELRGEYIQDALSHIKKGEKIPRGDIGIELGLMNISDAVKHFKLPESISEELLKIQVDQKKVVFVERILPDFFAGKDFKPGDIIYKVNGQLIGDDLYRFDKIINSLIEQKVQVSVFRSGKAIQLEPMVEDSDKSRLKNFALFAGGVFHDLHPEIRRQFEIWGSGTFMSQANQGTSMSQVGFNPSEKHPTSFYIVVEAVNGQPTPNLAEFIKVSKELKNHDHINVLVRDFNSYRNSLNAVKLTLELKFHPLKLFQLNSEKLEWEESLSP